MLLLYPSQTRPATPSRLVAFIKTNTSSAVSSTDWITVNALCFSNTSFSHQFPVEQSCLVWLCDACIWYVEGWELKLYFYPSAGGLKKKEKKAVWYYCYRLISRLFSSLFASLKDLPTPFTSWYTAVIHVVAVVRAEYTYSTHSRSYET